MPFFSAERQGNAIRLRWLAPTNPPSVRVVRQLNDEPGDPLAAPLVYAGTALEAFDDVADLLPTTTAVPRTYTYWLLACDNAGANCVATGLTDAVNITITEALLAGGYVIYFRHAETVDSTRTPPTDVCQDNLNLGYANTTATPDWWRSCTPDAVADPNWTCAGANVRQLSPRGVMDAVLAGNNIRARGIPFGAVLASEMCRGFKTADLMDLGITEHRPELTYYVYGNVRNRCNDLRTLITTVPAAGTNTALVSHSAIAGDDGTDATVDTALCNALDGSGRGNGSIYKPDGMGGYLLIQAGITPAAWMTLP